MSSQNENGPDIGQVIDLDGRVVIVTGAGSGIGAATARQLVEAGALPVLADADGAKVHAEAEELEALGIVADITRRHDVDALVAATLDQHGRIDGLVNNAGLSLHKAIADVDLDEFTRVLAVNVVGVLALTQAVLPYMRSAGFGRIVNVSSGTTRMVVVGAGPYSASKSAVNMLSAVARAELAPDGIAVSLVLPSTTATSFNDGSYKRGEETVSGLVAQSPDVPASAIIRALRTGEEAIDVPHGEQDPEIFAIRGRDAVALAARLNRDPTVGTE